MNIQSINNTNYINKNTSFKSKIVPTEFLEKTIDMAIEQPICKTSFYNNLVKIMNDGKNNIVKFDFAKGKLLQFLLPGAYNVTVDGNKRPWNCFFGNITPEAQCIYAIMDYAKDIDYTPQNSRLNKIEKRIQSAWNDMLGNNLYDMPKGKAEKHLKKKYEYLKGLYNRTLSEEFVKLKNEIFKPE